MLSFFQTKKAIFNHSISALEQHFFVKTGKAVLLKASDDHAHLTTVGLRTCVAFALINSEDESGLLIHFFSLAQIKTSLHELVSLFLEKYDPRPVHLVCHIAGGRLFCHESEMMHQQLVDYAKGRLLSQAGVLKLRIEPLEQLMDEPETLTLTINLKTGESNVLIDGKTMESDAAYEVDLERIEVSDLIPFSRIYRA